eukprot:CAMPEP_0170903224 /NCGR_PEP_ID=MMETSP0734-20130129/49637_1 /TAXON_ID=186038 /ORGANISM="Fragilariopsis kerguelensis, Strain L26-C5" /LENGTH=119 /DNA_ID=CAMNT_0011298365 /DNA_START=67 /DNA_END=423 /DNA_ORIENTATION=-
MIVMNNINENDDTTTNGATATTTTIFEIILDHVGTSNTSSNAFEMGIGSYFMNPSTFWYIDVAWLSALSRAEVLRRQSYGKRIIAEVTQSSEAVMNPEEAYYTEICPYDIDSEGNVIDD